MSKPVQLYVPSPRLNGVPEGPYFGIIQCLDKNSLISLSLVSRENYKEIYKRAIETLLVQYKISPPPSLTFFERGYRGSGKILGKNDDLELLKKRFKDISFASNPKHNRFLAILNGAFPERITYAEKIEKAVNSSAEEYQMWMSGEVFAGSTGLDVSIFLQNIQGLMDRYRESWVIQKHLRTKGFQEESQDSRHLSILETLKSAQTVFPSNDLKQVIQRLEENPRIEIFEPPAFITFKGAVESTLNAQYAALKMKDIADAISSWVSCELGERAALENSFKKILPSIQTLLQLPSELFVQQLAFSQKEADSLRGALTFVVDVSELIFGNLLDVAPLFETINGVLKKGAEKQSAELSKRNQHTTALWRAIFLEDRESLRRMINSSAVFYFQWGEVLEDILKNGQFALFLHLYPQVVDFLSAGEAEAISCSFFTNRAHSLDKYDPSALLPLLGRDLSVTKSFNRFEVLTRLFLPAFLGERDIHVVQWTKLCVLNLYKYPSAEFWGIALNALVRAGKINPVRVFLEVPHLQKYIPSTSSSNPLIDFFSSYPLLWDRLCCHDDEGAQLVAQMLMGLNPQCYLLEPATCVEIIQFLLAHPEMIRVITQLENGKLNLLLSKFNNYCSLSRFDHYHSVERLDSQEAIRQALKQALQAEINQQRLHGQRLSECRLDEFQPTINVLADILFAHDRCLLKIFAQTAHKEGASAFNFEQMFNFVQRGAPLLVALSTPSQAQNNLPKKIPHKTLDLLSAMGCHLGKYRGKVQVVGWDTIFQNAAAHPALLNLLASYPTAAVEMPQQLREQHLSQTLKAHAKEFQAFSSPQEGASRDVAEHIGKLMEAYPALLTTGWKTLKEKSFFFRRVALIFKLPEFLSIDKCNNFYTDLSFFYQTIWEIGAIWIRFRRAFSLL